MRKITRWIKRKKACKAAGYNCSECIYHKHIFDGSIFRGTACLIGRIGDEPERHGRWEITPTYGILVCSACRNCYIDKDWTAGKKWSFCPECGADMRGGQKADE